MLPVLHDGAFLLDFWSCIENSSTIADPMENTVTEQFTKSGCQRVLVVRAGMIFQKVWILRLRN